MTTWLLRCFKCKQKFDAVLVENNYNVVFIVLEKDFFSEAKFEELITTFWNKGSNTISLEYETAWMN